MQIQSLVSKIGTPAIPIVARLFNDPDPKVRFRSLATLAEMKGDKTEAIPALVGILEDPDFKVQAVAADVLGELGPTAHPAAPNLRRLLSATNADVQVNASIALWRIDRDTNVLFVIIRNLKESSRWAAILSTLGEMGPPARPSVQNVLEAIPLWERHTNWGMWKPEIRDRAREAIAKIDPEAVARIKDPRTRLGFGGPGWMPH